jgi:glucokinase
MASLRNGSPVVGVDLGGTKILVGVIDAENRILGRAKRATPAKEGGEEIVRAIVEAIEAALSEADVHRGDIAAIGIGSPGPLDAESGVIHFSANLNVHDFPLGPEVARVMGRPTLLQNDVRAGGYGEFRLGAGRGFRNLLAAFVGTGIGGCVIQNGQLLVGATGNAGELGHTVVKAGGPRCGCGQRGCMEALASRTAITRRIAKAIRKGIPTVLDDKVVSKTSRLKSHDLAAAVAANDPVAIKEVSRAAHYLGLGLGSLVNVLGPELVIIGGGVAGALGEPYLEQVRHSLRAQAIVDPTGRVRVERAALGDDAGILGAALLARERFA